MFSRILQIFSRNFDFLAKMNFAKKCELIRNFLTKAFTENNFAKIKISKSCAKKEWNTLFCQSSALELLFYHN